MQRDAWLDHWDAVDGAFTAMLERPEAERPGFLARVCVEQPHLADTLRALLAAQRRAGDFLEQECRVAYQPLLDAFASVEPDDDPPAVNPAGERVGPYRLLRQIGRGGTGTVYLAERDNGTYQHRVALKVLRRGLDTDDILTRFRAERQILAALNHPHIARLLDGGVTEDHRPYLVMELVEGLPINDYCQVNGLGIEARLRLFQDVGRAVQFAHQQLVIHRDLKPANILVAADGQVKLLDFGIAKLVDSSQFPGTIPETRLGILLMTPEYASPEQMVGGPVSIASDVYQLGLLLYELLTGRRPPSSGRHPGAAERALAATEPPPPSSVVPTPALGWPRHVRTPSDEALPSRNELRRMRAQLRGDLDTIVMKALSVDPERRYPTAAAFVEDVERHLTGQPVRARPHTWRYRARKFVMRHPVPVAGALTLALAGAAYTVAVSEHAEQLAVERNLAEAERQQAIEARQVAAAEEQRATAERDRAEAESVRAREALAHARLEGDKAEQVAEFLIGLFDASGFSADQTSDPTARQLLERGADTIRQQLHDQPEVRAALLSAIGRIHSNLGLFERAQPLLEESLALRRTLYGSHHPDVGESLILLGLNYQRNRSFAKAEPLYREALAIQQHTGADAGAQAGTRLQLAHALREAGQLDAAETLVREALRARRAAHADAHPAVVSTLGSLAVILRAKNDLAGAEALYREVLARQRADGTTGALELAATLNNYAYLLNVRKDHVAAVLHYREALAITTSSLGEAHRTTATATNNLVRALFDLDRLDEAETLLRERLEIERRHHPAQHWRVGVAYGELARLMTTRGHHQEAEAFLRDQVNAYAATLGNDHGWTAEARSRLARSLTAQRRFEEAEEQLIAALSAIEGAEQTDQRLDAKAEVERALVDLQREWGRPPLR